MPINLEYQPETEILEVQCSGKLDREDYEAFTPETEQLINTHGKLKILFSMHDFHGWKMGALWEDIKFDVKHFKDIDRIAMVGEKRWQEWMSLFCKPFTTAAVRYFEQDRIDEARAWLDEKEARS